MSLPTHTVDQIRSLLTSIDFGPFDKIEPLIDSIGQYNSIYIITSEQRKSVLRVTGTHVPVKKTLNEVAAMRSVRENTSIPVPKVIAHDASTNNPLDNEYTLLEYIPGLVLSSLIKTMSREDRVRLIDQIIDIQMELEAKSWDQIGGVPLLDGDGNEAGYGPSIDAHFFTPKDTNMPNPLSYNAYGPFPSFSAFCSAKLGKSWEVIHVIPSLENFKLMPVDRLLQAISSPKLMNRLDDSLEFKLAHRDLHLGNILYDPDTKRITAVLDWELATILPQQLWNPGNFLWTGESSAEADKIHQELLDICRERCEKRGLPDLTAAPVWSNDLQEKAMRAVTLLKWIVNGGVRGWQRDKMTTYAEEVEGCVKVLIDAVGL